MTTLNIPALDTVGARMALARRMGAVDQVDAARACRVARQTYSNWERGVTEPSFAALVRFAAFTGQPIEWFAEAVNDKEPAPVGTGSAASYTPRDLNPEPTDYGFEGDSRFFCLGVRADWELAS